MNFLVAIHLLIAIALIGLVMVQDSKGGGALGIGGGSNSLLGATGAQTLYAKLTRIAAALFAVTCLWLSIAISRESGRSVLDSAPVTTTTPPPATAPAQNPAPSPAVPAAPENTTAPANK